ncbi:MAG: hypothetical protein Q8Q39_04895 [bacterium]|nr:hypothetical protein [bacterium]
MSGKHLVVRQPGPEGRRDLAKPFWQWDAHQRRLWSPKLGVADQMVDVFDEESGLLDHEGQVFLERRAELSIPVDDKGNIGFVYIRREKAIPPALSRKFFKVSPRVIPPLELVTGIEEYELPHGLASESAEEVEEEIGRKVIEIIDIGDVKDSPPRGGAAHMLTIVRVSAEASGKYPDAGEQIRRVEFFAPECVRRIITPTICALTHAGIAKFRTWGLDIMPTDSFFHRIAIRL